MATGTITLPLSAATLPDGSSSNAAPALQRVKSSAAAPSPYFLQAAFDATTKEQIMWSFRMPVDYASGPVLKVQYKMASATTGNVIVEGRIAAVSDGDATDVDAKAFGSANSSSAITVPATAGYLDEITLTLTNADSLAAGDFVIVYLARDAVSDTATGDMEVVAVAVDYTTI
ncbi:hypothetical protein ABT340_04635 [Streptosporangium sp. NPDC000239]|uniref:hypothetical protein n=1 Tax=Streptosporangium sp. NPDC000239 TaxID=3154248 RepID=UPI00332834FE